MLRLLTIIMTSMVLLLAVGGGVMALPVTHSQHQMDMSMEDCAGADCNTPMSTACALHCLFATADVDVGVMSLSIASFVAVIAMAFAVRAVVDRQSTIRASLVPYRDPWATLTIIKRE